MKWIPGLLLAMALAPAPRAVAAPAAAFESLHRSVRQAKEATAFPAGTAIVVVKDGRIVFEDYSGYADIARGTPVTRDTAFYIASTTKPFVALGALLKEDAGMLDTGMTLQAMFPQARFGGFDARAVTMRDLLVHASGIDNPPLVWATAFSGLHDATSRQALVAASSPHAEAVHGAFRYSNVGYNIASVWLDRRFATPWQTQLDAAVFQPLGMHHTSASIGRAQAQDWPLAMPYSFASEAPLEPLYLRKADATMHAAGGLVSTAPDLARFLLAQLADGMVDGRQVLPRAVIARSQQPQVALEGRYLDFARTGYAWGWYTGEYKGRRMLHHFGAFAGFHAHLSFMPEEGIGLVVLNNDDLLAAPLTSLVANHVYGTLLGEADAEARLPARFAALEDEAKAARAAVAKQREAIRQRPWRLSLPRAAYAGRYVHDLLGTVHVASDDARMALRWGRLSAVASGYDAPDHVRVELVPNSGELVSFRVGGGRVEALDIDGMVFTRVP